MHIRPATAADIDAVRALEAQADTAAHWDQGEYQRLFSPDSPRLALVAGEAEEGTIRGFLIARQVGPEWEIENVVVDTGFRRRGLGAALLSGFLEMAKQQGGQSVFLEVRASNAAARALYLRFGFVETGRRRNYYHYPLEDALLYRLALQSETKSTSGCTENRALPKSG